MQEVEAQQVASLREELDKCHARLTARDAAYAALLQATLASAQCLATNALSAAFSHKARPMARFSANPTQHAALVERLTHAAAAGGQDVGDVTAEDAAAVTCRVKELLVAAADVSLHAERAEVALASEAEAMADELRSQLARANRQFDEASRDHEAKVTTMTMALRTATGRVEELMVQLAEAQAAATSVQQTASLRIADQESKARAHMEQVVYNPMHDRPAKLNIPQSAWLKRF